MADDAARDPAYGVAPGADAGPPPSGIDALRAREAEYRLLLEQAAEAIVIADSSLRIVSANERACELAGVPCAQIVGRHLESFIPAEGLAAEPLRLQSLGAGETVRLDRRLRRPDGEERMADVSARRLDDGRYHLILRDVTERRRAEEARRAVERRFQALVENAADLIAILDPDGTNRYASPSHLEVLGLRPEELEGRSCFDVVHPADAARLRGAFDTAMRTGRAPPALFRFRAADGGWRTVEVRLTDMRGTPAVGGIVANSRDVTAEREAEEARRASDALFSSAFHASRDAVIIFRMADELILDVNEAWLRTTGLPRERVIGHSQDEFSIWGPDEQRRFWERMNRDHFVRDFEFSFHQADGELGWAVLSAEVVTVNGEECALVIGRDITQQKRMESRLQEAQRLESLGRMAGGIAHDFNNLLTAITGFGDLALGAVGPHDPVRSDLLEIRAAAERASRLTRQLLAFSRSQVLAPRVVDVNAVALHLEPMLQHLVGDEVALALALDPRAAPVFADPSQLEQILVNLAVNARDAMPGGGVLTIETGDAVLDEHFAPEGTAVPGGRYVHVAVTDTGTGMDEATRTRVFEPFFTTKEMGHGTGLGLATVYGIVKQSRGHLRVVSAPGAGSAFHLFLPAAPPEAVPEPLPGEAPPGRAEGVEGAEGAGRGLRVLVVDDDRVVRSLVRRVLEKQGMEVFEAQGGADALWMWERHDERLDLLVTDVMMPGMDGRELARRLLAAHPGTRVLFMSGYADPAAAEAAGEAVPGPFLPKPFTTAQLLDAVSAAIPSG